MTIEYNRPLRGTEYLSSQGKTYSYKYSFSERMSDTRSPLTRTPFSTWREPTYYSREVETGYVQTYNVVVTSRRTRASTGEYVTNTITGASSCGGLYKQTSPSVPSRVTDHVTRQCLQKLKNQQVNLAQAFGERKQTARLVESSLIRVARSAIALKRGDLSGVAKAFGLRRLRGNLGSHKSFGRGARESRMTYEAFTDMWLELQYGWKPLLSDIHGSVSRLHEIESDGERLVATVTSKYTDREVKYHDPNPSSPDYMPYIGYSPQWRVEKRNEEEYKAFLRLDYIRSDPIPTDLLTELGFTNPASLAWELLPFSFVVDWSLPLGEYFSLLDAAKGWKLQGGSMSTKATRISTPVLKEVLPNVPSGWSRDYNNVTVTGQGRQMRFKRVPYEESPIPPPPSIKTTTSSLHVANGLALLSSVFLAGSSRVR